MNTNPNERQSEPTASPSAPKSELNAAEPLGSMACSAFLVPGIENPTPEEIRREKFIQKSQSLVEGFERFARSVLPKLAIALYPNDENLGQVRLRAALARLDALPPLRA